MDSNATECFEMEKEVESRTWNVRTLLGDNQQELLCSSACRSKLGLIAVQECRWEEIEEGKEMGGYLWFGGGAWKNSRQARTGGVLVGVHKSLEKAVMSKVHRKGRVQLVKLKGLMGRNLIFGSLYAPTESEEGDVSIHTHMPTHTVAHTHTCPHSHTVTQLGGFHRRE